MQGLDTCGGRGWWMAKQQKGSKGKRAGRGKGVCVLSSSVWCRGEELRFPACVPPPDHPLPPYLLASHPHQRLLTGYTANGHPYRFYNSIYVNTHLSNDWSGFELNPFPPTTPRASYRSAELLRQLLPPTGPPPGRMYLASLHRLRAFGRHLALHRRAQKSILTSVHLFPLVSLSRYKTLSLSRICTFDCRFFSDFDAYLIIEFFLSKTQPPTHWQTRVPSLDTRPKPGR